MMATDAPAISTVSVMLGFPPVRRHAGAGLLSRLQFFSPSGHSQQQDRRKNEHPILHRTVRIFLF
jgi:hypothetical protein